MINLRAITKGAIDLGFNIAAQIVVASSYNRVGGTAASEYDAEAGTVTANTRTIQPVGAMILSFSAKEIDGERVREGDERVFVRTSELTGLSEPARDDFIVDMATNLRRDVINFTADPTNTFWILQCRRNSG
jgi:hypothetical protein